MTDATRYQAWAKRRLNDARSEDRLPSITPSHNAVVGACVAMNQHIAKSDDAWEFSNGGCCALIETGQLIERFANDLELALNRGAQIVVGLVLDKGFGSREACDPFCCLLGIPQQFTRVRMHKPSGARL
jgi:hypothetical protein